jgi:hypothetical protein
MVIADIVNMRARVTRQNRRNSTQSTYTRQLCKKKMPENMLVSYYFELFALCNDASLHGSFVPLFRSQNKIFAVLEE